MARTMAEEDAIPNGWRTRRPGSIIYAVISLFGVPLYTFFYSVYFIPRRLRPSRKWTYRQAMMNQLMKFVCSVLTDLGFTQPMTLKPGKLGDRWVIMEPGTAEAYRGPLSSSLVKPERIGATWYPNFPPKDPSGAAGTGDGNCLVILCFHSGSFLWITGRPEDCAFSAGLLTSRLGHGTRALWVQYRLAGDPDNPTPYPGALQDALTAYLYLVNELGIPPHRIVLAGDSSGATMGVALLRYLASYAERSAGVQGRGLPGPPKACLIFSPSVDYSVEGDSQQMNKHRNHKTDYMEGRMAAWGARAFAPSPIRLDGPYLSPALHPFATPVPIFVQAGGAEVLCDTIRAFAEAMRAVPGNRIQYVEVPDAPHDIFMVGNVLGWQKEAEEVVDAAAAFVSRI